MQEEEENAQREEKFPSVAWQQRSLFALLPEHKQALCVPAHGKIPAGIHPEGEVGKAVSAYHRPHLGNGKTRNDPNISVDFSSCPCPTQKELPGLCEVPTFVSRYFLSCFSLGKWDPRGNGIGAFGWGKMPFSWWEKQEKHGDAFRARDTRAMGNTIQLDKWI